MRVKANGFFEFRWTAAERWKIKVCVKMNGVIPYETKKLTNFVSVDGIPGGKKHDTMKGSKQVCDRYHTVISWIAALQIKSWIAALQIVKS